MHLPPQGKNGFIVITSNTKKVIRQKQNNSWVYETIHWRTDTIKNLYEKCCLQHPVVSDCSTYYFAKFIPWFVRKKKNYSGLCWKHDLGIFFSTLLKKRRKIWHQNCTCNCIFCTLCQHGKNPVDGNCHDNSCKQCIVVECPVEWDDNIQGNNSKMS